MGVVTCRVFGGCVLCELRQSERAVSGTSGVYTPLMTESCVCPEDRAAMV